jgi:hypothetical protein
MAGNLAAASVDAEVAFIKRSLGGSIGEIGGLGYVYRFRLLEKSY